MQTDQESSGQQASEPAHDQDNELIKLRRLLLGHDYDSALHDYISKEHDADRVADVLSRAIRQSTRNDPALGKALAPIVNQAIEESIANNPEQITNVIFPVMGPAIRRAVGAALRDMVQNLNNVLEQSLSMKGITWRIKAWRAGVSYGRYVIAQTLKFRVEQVLLVHRDTGLLLNSVSEDSQHSNDPELISSMLTAMQDFMSDSFENHEQAKLDRIDMGDFTLHLYAGPYAIMAVAVTGNISQQASIKFEETLEHIHHDYARQLESFDGDIDPFENAESELRTCLISEKLKSGKHPKRRPWLALAALAVAGAYFSINAYDNYQTILKINNLLYSLEQQPGYILLNHEAQGHDVRIQLLYDKTARPPENIIQNARSMGLEVSLDAQLITLGAVDTQKLDALPYPEPPAPRDLKQQYRDTLASVNQATFLFDQDTALLTSGQEEKLPQLLDNLKALTDISERLQLPAPQIMILGFADPSGPKYANLNMSQRRAELVRELLISNGVSAAAITAWGLGNRDNASVEDILQRRASLHVLDQLAQTGKDT